ncbi:GIY-YIG nuclease family protein [Candidatus Saccharibacteria bacterium]|nr:GIY-YIG nuclease family protein [Candidatus Saccharibacteria bacterium]
MYYFYVLKSAKDGQYYYGSTNNIERRLNQHQSKLVLSTQHRLPLILVYYEAYRTFSLARLRERQVKKSGNARLTLFKRINSGP